ncbi:MAG: beta-N-acetylhexosaminidase [Christensenella sp.]|nr:beta-N-acetylhexosaminidase [Christensenella sp.]
MNLIPKPQKFEKKTGYCKIDNLLVYYVDDNISELKDTICSILRIGLKRELEFKKGNIDFIYNPSVKKEGYILDVSENSIVVQASTSVGALWAAQTIRVLGEFDLEEPILECCHIEDYPQYEWRGLLYDECRHFFGKEATKKLLDMMSLHKLNVLHWHLTDDQGWRIEIKKYPLLTEIGSKRKATHINGWQSLDVDQTPYEGFYTQEDIKEIINYAKNLGIMIVPEIDIPGHFSAAIAAYKNLACREMDCEVPWWFGGKIPFVQGIKYAGRPICVSKESSLNFVHDILDEVCDLFPAPYYHVGGDEAEMKEWKTCPDCQKKMKEKGFSNVAELQCDFINGIQKYVAKKNKRLIGWNEVLKGDALDNDVLVQYWTFNKDSKVKTHLKNGGDVILSKHQFFYFDMPYSQYQLKNTYKFTPKAVGVPKEHYKQVKGVEGAMWTEWIPDVYKFEFHLYPRFEALAEVAWNQNGKDYTEFLARLEKFKPILNKHKINYAENEVCNSMGLFKRARYRACWYNGDQRLELKENDLIKQSKKDI